MKVGFTGTRHGMTSQQQDSLEVVLLGLGQIKMVHHGDCVGADAEFHELVTGHGLFVAVHPPDKPHMRAWCKADRIFTPKSYFERDRDIVNACDVLIAAPAEMTEQRHGGTWYTVRYARQRGKPIWIVYRDGLIERPCAAQEPEAK